MGVLCSALLLWLVATLGGSRADYHSSHTNNWAVLVRKEDRARTAASHVYSNHEVSRKISAMLVSHKSILQLTLPECFL